MTVEQRVKEFAKIFNLEEGEKFNLICSSDRRYMYNPVRFINGMLENCKGKKIDYHSEVFGNLILGIEKVEKLPWKPNYGDYYWFVNKTRENGISKYPWEGTELDYRMYKYFKLFKTEREAIIERNKQVWWEK